MQIQDNVFIISGGASGLGAGTATMLAEAGAKVVIADLNEQTGQSLAAELNGQFIREGDNTYGGRVVTNPSGGLLSKGHPLGATGLAQCYELTHQLRGSAEARQVEGARVALQHNLGLGGACVVTMYRNG